MKWVLDTRGERIAIWPTIPLNHLFVWKYLIRIRYRQATTVPWRFLRVLADDRSVSARGLDWFDRPTVGQSLVRPFKVVMLNVLLEHMSKVPFPEEDHAVERLSLGILYPCSGICVYRQITPH